MLQHVFSETATELLGFDIIVKEKLSLLTVLIQTTAETGSCDSIERTWHSKQGVVRVNHI